jgi:hypothetical protein
MIYEYVKDKYGHLKGVVCATSKNGIGWSLCHSLDKKKGFNKKLAISIAEGRAKKMEKLFDSIEENETIDFYVPSSIKNNFDGMMDRAERYYK